MTRTPPAIDRREALRRAALLFGGALSAPTIAGVLAGCDARAARDGEWTPRVLTPDQLELVATIAEHILPETDTPGARAVGVHRFIDAMLAESFPAEERRRFVDGLRDLVPPVQAAQVEEMDRAATPGSFFHTMKELTLVGYYTSEVGATRELRHAPVPGRFEGCVPLTQVGRTWAV